MRRSRVKNQHVTVSGASDNPKLTKGQPESLIAAWRPGRLEWIGSGGLT